ELDVVQETRLAGAELLLLLAGELAQLLLGAVPQHLLGLGKLFARMFQGVVGLDHVAEAGVLTAIALEQRWVTKRLGLCHERVQLFIAGRKRGKLALKICALHWKHPPEMMAVCWEGSCC